MRTSGSVADRVIITASEQTATQYNYTRVGLRWLFLPQAVNEIGWEWQSGLRVRYESRYPAPEGWKDQIKVPTNRDDMGRFQVLDRETGELR